MRMDRHVKAFTLVELMVGLMVTSIILAAVATLAFALSTGATAGSDYAYTQAQIRRATVYVSDLIAQCSLICAAPGYDLAIWRSDDNNNGRINLNELVYLERGADRQYLRLCGFESTSNPEIALADLASPTAKGQFITAYGAHYTPLIPDCSDAQFSFLGVPPPRTAVLGITFEFAEDRTMHQYEIVAAARCLAVHRLNAAGDAIVATDDD